MKDVVAFNFDDIIENHISKWNALKYVDPNYDWNTGITDDEIKLFVKDVQIAGYDVVIVSNKCTTNEGIEDIRNWANGFGIKPDRISAEEPLAAVRIKFYIDDSIEMDKSILSEQILGL